MAADRELSEEQERELYRHYGVPTPGPTRQAASPPANPGPPNRPWRLAYLSLRRSRCPSAHPMWLLGGPRCLLRRQPAAEEPLPTGGGALLEAAAQGADPRLRGWASTRAGR